MEIPGALVAYLYEECEPEVRRVIAAHLVRCESCSSEIDSLGWTRGRLQAWTPPAPELGFPDSGAGSEPRLPWWRAPLPAWAQAAAACLIFGVGLSLGLARTPARRAAGAVEWAARCRHRPTSRVADRAVSQLERAAARPKWRRCGPRPPAPVRQATASNDEIMKKVEALVAQSEERQRREFTLRSVEMARDFEAQRRIDMATVRETVGQFQGVAGTEIRQQREAIDRINNLHQGFAAGPVATMATREW